MKLWKFIIKIMINIVIYGMVISLLLFLNLSFFKEYFSYNLLEKKDSQNYNLYPVEIFHKGEFDIKNSNYLERNYERYINYRNNHKDISDDEIITYVNIGLDNSFYTNMRPSKVDDGNLILCNKYNYLAPSYVPKNLVSTYSPYSYGGMLVKEAYTAFKKMADDAKKDGYVIKITSPYRSYYSQKSIYANYVKRDGVIKADTYSARAGSSEHQTGLVVDINDGVISYSYFRNSKSYQWMSQNAYKYGWIIRYTKENQWITGYKQEEWHYRYVGVEVSKYIYEHKITFEEYYATFVEK